MNMKTDWEYVCMLLNNGLELPVRLFDKEKRILYRSNVVLPKDPLSAYEKEVFAVRGHIGFFSTKHEYYYAVASFGEKRIVVGPTRQTDVKEWELKEIAFEVGVPRADADDFVRGMRSLSRLSIKSVLQMLLLVNHFVNEGEKLSLPDVFINEGTQKEIAETLTEHEADYVPEEGKTSSYRMLIIERRMMEAVMTGDLDDLHALFSELPLIRGGVIASSEVGQSRNLLIVSATLSARAAINGGMDPEEAMGISDRYIRHSELLPTAEEVDNLSYRMIIDFAERISKTVGKIRSVLVAEVSAYVRQHISEAITVEELARHLHRGRCRLSTVFKREMGENLSEYILKQKTEEGKKRLAYTDKSIADIAAYLGFSSQSHFTRVFKKYTGLTPNAYRNEEQQKRNLPY